jgi:hypothetical protein
VAAAAGFLLFFDLAFFLGPSSASRAKRSSGRVLPGVWGREGVGRRRRGIGRGREARGTMRERYGGK